MMFPIKRNLHGYYVDTLSGAAFIPPEMLDFIDEHLGGVDNFVKIINLHREMIETLKELRLCFCASHNHPGSALIINAYKEILDKTAQLIAKMEGVNEDHKQKT